MLQPCDFRTQCHGSLGTSRCRLHGVCECMVDDADMGEEDVGDEDEEA